MSSVGNGRKAIQIRYRFVQPKDTSVHVVQFMDQFHVRDSCNRADQEAGLAAAALLVRLIAKLLFATAPLDPPTFAAEPILIGAVALAASHMPPPTAARRPIVPRQASPQACVPNVCQLRKSRLDSPAHNRSVSLRNLLIQLTLSIQNPSRPTSAIIGKTGFV